MTTLPSAEVTAWAPPLPKAQGSRKRASTIMLESMAAGATLRITHTDMCCRWPDYPSTCSLASVVSRLRLQHGWNIELYHEAKHVAVVRRLEDRTSGRTSNG